MTKEELQAKRAEGLKKARAKAAENRAARAAAAATAKRYDPPESARVATPKSDVPHEFLGITKSDCCVDCTADRCVISGRPVCAHPMKGGLQPVHQLDTDAADRYQRARKHLAHVELDRRQ